MVFQKKLDVGFIGCQIPTMPRFPRSARGKRSPPKKVENNQMHPFDLLATVAGELLEKRESSCSLYETAERTKNHVNTIKQKHLDNGSPSKSDVFDQGSCDEGSFVARFVSHEERRAASALALVKSDVSEKDGFARKSAQSIGTLKCELQKLKATVSLKNDRIGIHNLEDPMILDSKAIALVSSDSSVELTPSVDYHSAYSSSFQSVKDGAELVVDKDDDENSSGRTHNCALYSKAFKPHCTVERRVRKMTTSNYWKADREAMINDGERWNREIKPALHSRKLSYTRQRTQRCSFKRKKLLERFSSSASNGGFCSQDVPDSLVKCDTKFDSSDPQAHLNDAQGRSCSTTDQRLSYESADHPVKLSIKSFRVPELFIEIPANATVGSLKRTVMEAVTAVLSGGLRVGVLLQGKKIRDDNKTLVQAGISNTDKLDNLGFTLEPNPNRAPPPHKSNSREPESPNKILSHADQATPDTITQPPPPNTTANCTDSDHDSVHSHANPSSSVDQMYDNSKALVPILAVKSDALSVIPLRNSRRSEMVRRIRRPFSVSEVEALVQAVEKLGTGRWRDVKLRAFDSVKHRTYVDLKDKWKTLVHTARISPQQRRGEPVPQDLLDRVLSAHAYWCQQQAKSTRLAEPYLLPA
ncbi:telomere repeat-binding protein 2-like [Dendrobium catenatum]|uniref:telomere repeat-binding protein 2-like n=1 Tax=Dendrobium catenatum TaxID=906689 RepID=UPI0009F39057|nr:telomere repeat-binding protein 2-like [Dendrobium catenatum]